GGEFGLVAAARAGDVDFGILAGEARRIPFLPLPAIAALPSSSGHSARDIVDQPVRDLAEPFNRADAGLFVKLSLCRLPGVLAGVDAALWHLPDMGLVDMLNAAGSPADENQPGRVEQHHPNAGSIGQVFVARHSVRTFVVGDLV